MPDTRTQADIFRRFLNHVWEGGPDYDLYSDAREVAQAMGAKKTGQGTAQDWSEYLFPDGSTAEILNDGSGVDDPPDPTGLYDQTA